MFLFSCASSSPFPEEGISLTPPETDPVWVESDIPGMRILLEMDQNQAVGGAAVALDTEFLGFVVSPPDPTGKGETRSAKTSEFARQTNVLLAINGSPYNPANPFNRSNKAMDIVGIHIYEGETLSLAVPYFDALYILENGEIRLGSQNIIPYGTWMAIGGFHLLLKEGDNLGINDMRHPRTALGLSEDGKIFYLAVFDGRQSERAGLTTEETALWMSWLGCHSALNMDGGGSSTLVINENGTVRILNNPVHRGRPGSERAVANHLGLLIK